MHKLSPKQLQFYRDNGYLLIKNFIDGTSLERYRQRFHDVVSGAAERGEIFSVPELVAEDDGSTRKVVNKLHDIHFDGVFAAYTEHAPLLAVVRQLLGADELRVVSSMFVNKPPRSRRHPPHQDLAYFPLRPAAAVAASWTAVDRATSRNGALFVLPRSHVADTLYEHGNVPGTNKAFHSVLSPAAADERAAVTLEMEPGDTLFFHSLLVHGSGANDTETSRNCISAHYASAQTYFVERGAARAAVARDMDAAAASRGWNCTYEDYLRFRSKAVPTTPKSTL